MLCKGQHLPCTGHGGQALTQAVCNHLLVNIYSQLGNNLTMISGEDSRL